MTARQSSEEPYEAFAKSVTPKWRHDLWFTPDLNGDPIHVVDISSTGNIHHHHLELGYEAFFKTGHYEARLGAEREALRNEGRDIKTRLVLFSPSHHMDKFLCDLYGVDFQIEPSFFVACKPAGSRPLFLHEDPPAFLDLGRGCCAKFVHQHYDHPLIRRGLTLVLICLPDDFNFAAVQTSTIPQDISMDLDFTDAPAISVQGVAPDPVHLWSQAPATLNLAELCILMISRWESVERIDANEHPLRFLFPLLELYVNRFEAIAVNSYHKFLEERASTSPASGFESSWRPLRDAMVSATLPFEAFKQYDSCHANGALQQSSKLPRLLRRFDHLLKEASQFEQHIRDELQLQVGHLSLRESRESIKQSKLAMEESKRVKMLTILVFIFIPISLATSVFGMNIQELNSTGQPLFVFVVTAGAILLAAFCIWAMFYQWTKYVHAPSKTRAFSEYRDEMCANINVWRRIRLILWLISHGHAIWCWRSGIIFSLLTKGRKGFTMTCDANERSCRCAKELDLREFRRHNEDDRHPPFSFSTHSAHGPVAYVYAHAHARGLSRTAFSLAKDD